MGPLGAKSIINQLGWVAVPAVLAAAGIVDWSLSFPRPHLVHMDPSHRPCGGLSFREGWGLIHGPTEGQWQSQSQGRASRLPSVFIRLSLGAALSAARGSGADGEEEGRSSTGGPKHTVQRTKYQRYDKNKHTHTKAFVCVCVCVCMCICVYACTCVCTCCRAHTCSCAQVCIVCTCACICVHTCVHGYVCDACWCTRVSVWGLGTPHPTWGSQKI